eukprot:m.220209 g.220209  ORF g.220209 m.220209 type:complete len:1370 (+) comp13829_c1_seq2:102-4211(+)
MVDPLSAFASEADDELKNIRLQMRSLQHRTSKKVDMLRDMQLFFVRQAEIEQAYGKQLESLHNKFSKPRSERSAVSNVAKALTSRRPGGEEENDTGTPPEDVEGLVDGLWTCMLTQLKKRANARIRFANKLGQEMKSRFDSLEKETSSTSKKCLELGHALHTDLQSSFKHTEETLRHYHTQQGKYCKAVEQHQKAIDKGQLKKGGKMKEKVSSAEKKSTLARNEYILSRTASNTRKKRFYDVEVGRLFDVMDLYYHSSIRYTFKILDDMHKQNLAIEERCFGTVIGCAKEISPQNDREKFMKENAVYFGSRPSFDHLAYRSDAVDSVVCNPDTLSDLMQRFTDTSALVSKSALQMHRERETLQTITALRLEKIGHTLQMDDHGVYKSVENSVMLTECYHRLVNNTLHFHSLNKQLSLLGESLGPNKPQTAQNFEEDLKTAQLEDEDMFEELMAASSKEVSATELVQTGSLRRLSSTGSVNNNSATVASTATHLRDDLSPIRSRSDSVSSQTSTDDANKQAETRRPAPAPPQPQSPRLGRAKKRNKRPERPPDPRKLGGKKSSPKSKHVAKLRTKTISSQNPYKFGGVLEEIAEVTNMEVPMIIISCIKSLRECGMDVEGIFRVPGSQAQVEEIQRGFETGRDPFFRGTPDHIQPFAVAGVLKLYLRMLGDSVMTHEHYRKFVEVASLPDHTMRMETLRHCIHTYLPHANLMLLRTLLPFLKEISEIKENKMSVANIAVVFGPTLMPAPKDDTTAMVRNAAAINSIVSMMIDYHEWLLRSDEDNDSDDQNEDFSDTDDEEKDTKQLTDSNEETREQELKQEEKEEQVQEENNQQQQQLQLQDNEGKDTRRGSQQKLLAGTLAAEMKQKSRNKLRGTNDNDPTNENDNSNDTTGSSSDITSKQTEPTPVARPRTQTNAKTTPTASTGADDHQYVIALHSYEGRNPSELSFKKGDKLRVQGRVDANWWKGIVDGKKGYIASSYVKEVPKEEPQVDLQMKEEVANDMKGKEHQHDRSKTLTAPPVKSTKKPSPKVPRRHSEQLPGVTKKKKGIVPVPGQKPKPKPMIRPRTNTKEKVQPPTRPPPPEIIKPREESNSDDVELDLDAIAKLAHEQNSSYLQNETLNASTNGDDGDEDNGYLAISEVQAHRQATPTFPPSFAVPPPPPPDDEDNNNAVSVVDADADEGDEEDDTIVADVDDNVDEDDGQNSSKRNSRTGSRRITIIGRGSVSGRRESFPRKASSTDVDTVNTSYTDVRQSDHDIHTSFPPPPPTFSDNENGHEVDDDEEDNEDEDFTNEAAPPRPRLPSTLTDDGSSDDLSFTASHRQSRSLSFGPTFAPPPPPPASDLPPPPPTDDADDDFFLVMPPPPAPLDD